MADCPLHLEAGASTRLSYGPNFTAEKLQLLEVDEELLQEIIASGVVIKGAPADEAVLCTASKTFVLKQVETSNTLLLIPPAVRLRRSGRAARALTRLRAGRRAHGYRSRCVAPVPLRLRAQRALTRARHTRRRGRAGGRASAVADGGSNLLCDGAL